MRLPLGQTRPDIHILAILAYLVMHDAMHHVDRGGLLRELEGHLDAHEEGLIGA